MYQWLYSNKISYVIFLTATIRAVINMRTNFVWSQTNPQVKYMIYEKRDFTDSIYSSKQLAEEINWHNWQKEKEIVKENLSCYIRGFAIVLFEFS